jgi:RecA-family ATPase
MMKTQATPPAITGGNNNGGNATNNNHNTKLSLFGMQTGLQRWNGEPAPPDWLVDNLLHRGIISILDGIGDSGKSILALQLAIDVAGGMHFVEHHDFKCKQGKVLYLNAEDPDSQMHIRFRKMTQGLSEERLDDIRQNLTVIPFLSLDISPQLMRKSKGENSITPAFGELLAFCQKCPPSLVILDPLAYFGNVEGHVEDVIDFYSLLKKLKTTVLLLHHQSKAAMNGEISQRAKARGPSAIVENSKLRMALEKQQLIIDKHNYGKKMTISLEFDYDACRWSMRDIIETKKEKIRNKNNGNGKGAI